MVNPLKDQVITALTHASLPPEALANAGLYLVEVSDARVRAALDARHDFEERCRLLSKATELGFLALEAAHPLGMTTDVQARFNELEERFSGVLTSFDRSMKEALQLHFQVELDRVFNEGGILEQRVRALVSKDGDLARTLQEKGFELSNLFDPSNKNSFVARFESLLAEYLSANGSVAKLFSPEHKGSYADRLSMLLEEYFGAEAGRIKLLLDPNLSTSPFGKIRSDVENRQHAVNQHVVNLIAEVKTGFSSQFEALKTDMIAVQSRVEGYVQAFEGRAKLLEEAEQHAQELEAAKRKQSFYAGHSFEARLVDFLDQFAGPRQDSATYTGNIAAIDGKIGDIVYGLNLDGVWEHSAHIALEVRNRACPRTGKSAFFLDDLEAAMQNRQCAFGIVVACLEKNIDNGRPRFNYLQQYPRNRFVVLVDEEVTVPTALEAALHLIHRIAQFRGGAEQQIVDAQRINDAVAKALSVTEKFRALKSNLTTNITGLTTIRRYVDEMAEDVERALREAQNEVQKALQGKMEPMVGITTAA